MLPFILFLTICQSTQAPSQEIRAAMFLGSRVAQVQRLLPVIQQVVLVPDEATYLDEISRWSTKARWPVLFDVEPHASQFIRRFLPKQVWRRDPVGTPITNIELQIEQTVAQAWDGTSSVDIALSNLKLPPTGVVFTSKADGARTAAVALAAGRGQLIRFISSDWGRPQDILSHAKTTQLLKEIDSALVSTGVKFVNLGDTIDAITICQTMPSRVEFIRSADSPVALSDVVGRDSNGNRFAWSGWIFGSKAQSAYIAMCSLFLERDQYWFCDTYPNSGGWAQYGLGTIEQNLPNFGIDSDVVDGTLAGLRQAEVGGISADLLYFTSKGNLDFLDMANERTAPTWLPILNTPSALYFLHSWSLKIPTNPTSVGGVWLSRGVYAYIGSSHEPNLSAFVPPIEMLRKTMSLIPFLIAGRWADGEQLYSKAWRVNTIGDPLMLCPPKGVVKRTFKPAEERDDYHSVTKMAQDAMRIASDSPSDNSFTNAIGLLVLLHRDDMASALWRAAIKNNATGTSSAKTVLPALFRLQHIDAFIVAYMLIKKPTNIEQDMLWQLVGTDPRTPLYLLIDNLRSPYELDDILVIANRLNAKSGSSAVLALINKSLQTATGRNKRGLQRLRKEYGG